MIKLRNFVADIRLSGTLKQKILIWAFGLFFLTDSFAQFSAERSGMNNLEKEKWDKAKSQFRKAMRKDSLNAVAHYGLSIYFLTPENPEYQIDSAYSQIITAIADYELTPLKDKEKMRRFPLDSIILSSQKVRIDSTAFARAKDIDTEAAYIFFIDNFSTASQLSLARELRDEVAYLDALKLNTHQSFWAYLQKYPNSVRAADARKRFDKLIYEAKTSDKTLNSYKSFLEEFPETPYRAEVEIQIFEISTAPGEVDDFEEFIKRFPKSIIVSRSKNILYYLLKDRELTIPKYLLTDSLRSVRSLEQQYLVPFLEGKLFGMMNDKGDVIIKPISQEIDAEYLCGDVTKDVLVMGNQMVARNGKILYKGPIKEVEDLGIGFIKIITNSCVHVVHKSGWKLNEECVEDAKLLGRRFFILKEHSKWSLWTLTGRRLTANDWDDIDDEGDVMIFKKGSRYSLTLMNSVSGLANKQPLLFGYEVDDIKAWRDRMLWVKKGNEQGVLTSTLVTWIPFAKQELTSESFGAMSKSDVGYKLIYKPVGVSQPFSKIKINKPWVAGYESGSWKLVETSLKITLESTYDSISFVGPFAVCVRNDTSRIYFNTINSVVVPNQTALQFIPGRDSLFFLLIDYGDKKILYDATGQTSIALPYDKVDNAGNGFLIITKKDKKGIASLDGRVVTIPDYDAIGTVQNGKVSVLKNKKFGLIDLVNRREIKPLYERNILLYNDFYLKAFKDGGWGLIDWKNKPVLNFEFEEIVFWSDSIALLKKNFQWMLYDLVERKIIIDKIKDFKWVSNDEQERILIIHQDNNYGVISSRRGEIIPTTFSDIMNLGSSSNPFYFTEKHVEEASIFVVIYYNQVGELVKRQVFEIDDYERIYCSDN